MSGIEYKSSGFAVALKAEPGGDGWLIGGYASTFGPPADYVGDVIDRHAYDMTLLARPVVPILYQHDQYQPIGKSLFLATDDYGLLFQAKIAPTRQGTDTRILIEHGILQDLSIGYSCKSRPSSLPDALRELIHIDLLEISCVTWGANPKAKLTMAGPAKQMLLDRLTVARVDHDMKSGIPLSVQSKATRAAYFAAIERELQRATHGGKTAREVLYSIEYELQELRRLQQSSR